MNRLCWLLPLSLLGSCAVLARTMPNPYPPVDWSRSEWRTVVARPGVSLRGLCVVDQDVIWASGSKGTVLRSIDGGATWQDRAPPGENASLRHDAALTTCDFRDVHAFDRDTAVVMVAGQPARLYRTADGGASWTIVHEDPRPAAFFDAIAFDGDRGFLLGDPLDGAFTLLRSDDRGATWRTMPGPAAIAGEACFAASGTCLDATADNVRFVTGGTACRMFLSRDGAQTWQTGELPMRHGEASQGAFGIGLTGCDLIVVGGDYAAPHATAGTAAVCNTGETHLWAVRGDGVLGYRSAVVWLDAMQLLAVGEGGASFSNDGARRWQPFGSEGFHALAKGRDGAVFACGGGGRIARLVPPR
jgi:photosystem II stability/assembly factor-like uncharacterized protein